MQADEQVRLAIVRRRRTLVDADETVIVSRQDDPHAEAAFDERAQPSRDVQRQLFFLETVGTLHTDLIAPVSGIDGQCLAAPGAARGREAGIPGSEAWVGSGSGTPGREPGLRRGTSIATRVALSAVVTVVRARPA